MAKEIILGIDFSRDYSQLSYLDDTGKPKSVSIGTENNYLIPTAVCFNSELKEWSAGDEAINKSHSENSRLIRELPLLFNEDTEEDVGKIMTVFFAYLLKLAVNQCMEDL